MSNQQTKFGVGYRNALRESLNESANQFDVLEILVEQFIGQRNGPRILEDLASRHTLLPHGVGLSVGSPNLPSRRYLDQIKSICEVTQSEFYSEHLCITRGGDIDLGHLSPFPLTQESLSTVIRNVQYLQEYLERPMLLENITIPFSFKNDEFLYPEFMMEVAKRSGCGLLLDIANLYINSVNHGYDANEFVDKLSSDSVNYFHLAGGIVDHMMLIDSHSQPVPPPVWRLYEYAFHSLQPEYVVIERDSNFPDIEELVREVNTARQVTSAHERSGAH